MRFLFESCPLDPTEFWNCTKLALLLRLLMVMSRLPKLGGQQVGMNNLKTLSNNALNASAVSPSCSKDFELRI